MSNKHSYVFTMTNWCLTHPWTTVLLTIVIIFGTASGVRHLTFDPDYRVFFGDDNPQLQAFDLLESTYNKNDNVFIIVAPKDGNVFTRDTLASVEQLTKRSWQVPYSSRVDSLTNFQHSSANGDDLIVRDFIKDGAALSDDKLVELRHEALNEPQLLNRYISSSAHVTAVNITIQLPGVDNAVETPEVMLFTRQMVEQIRNENANLDIYITGLLALNNAFDEGGQQDGQTIVPASFGVILIFVLLFLRGMFATIGVFFVIIFSILGAMGTSGWLGIPITSVLVSAPTMILTLAIANAIHILVTFLHELRNAKTKLDAMAESLRINIQPVFLTSITTAIGFLTMNFSDAPPFNDLGNVVALGVCISLLLSVTFLPALMMIVPVRASSKQGSLSNHMAKFSQWVINRRKSILATSAIITLVITGFIPRNEVNTEFVSYFDQSIPFRVASDFANDNLPGIYQISYSLDSGTTNGLYDVDFLREVDQFVSWYEKQENIVFVDSYSKTLKRLNKNMHGDDETWYQLPENRELAAQYLLLYEMSLPYGLDLNNQINIDKSATRINVSLKNISTKDLIALENRAQQWLQQNTRYINNSVGSGPIVMFSHLTLRNTQSMIAGTIFALVCISLILIFALRSFKIGIVSLIPNLVPAAIGFGIWGLLVGEVDMGLAVVIGMTLGIVVDDTVHFLSKYLRARRELNLIPSAAVTYAFSTVGSALFITSITLVAGFSLLAQSSFRFNADMGTMTAIIIAVALIADFLLLPTLLLRIENKNEISVASQRQDPPEDIVEDSV